MSFLFITHTSPLYESEASTNIYFRTFLLKIERQYGRLITLTLRTLETEGKEMFREKFTLLKYFSVILQIIMFLGP